ncbi:YidB family protein [Herminiimonas sp. CN]|uniref:YidB family protein n=1 Tax=Herminiimonas sp. CN TaxID=1349818 RepID=UPI000474303A|nr:YidB family protein [Herminiimonas sp. CN]
MGLLDMAMGMLGGDQQQPGDPKAQLLQAALQMLSDNQGGGLQGLMGSLKNAGLGDALASWIGTGQNTPVSGDQIQQALGDGGQLQQLAQAAGLSQSDAASHLSEMLPGLIDRLTPNGEVPQGGLGDLAGMLGQFLGKRQ